MPPDIVTRSFPIWEQELAVASLSVVIAGLVRRLTIQVMTIFPLVIPGRAERANPESRNRHRARIWIPGPALMRRPGMTSGRRHRRPIWPVSARPDPRDVTHLASRAGVAFAVDVHGSPGNSQPARRVIDFIADQHDHFDGSAEAKGFAERPAGNRANVLLEL